MQTLPSPGRAAFLIGTTVPTVIPSGDAQFNRQQDQTNASLLSLGGGTRRGNNYTLDGVPITDLRNRATANPSIESLEDMKVQVHTYDAEMGRTGGGVFNTTLRAGANSLHGTGFVQTRPIWGQTNNFFSEKAGLGKPDSPYYLGGGAIGGPIAPQPHVLLVLDRELPRRADAQRQRHDADRARTARRLLADDQRRRRAGDHLRSADRPAVRRQPDPVRAASTRRPRRCCSTCRCADVERSNGCDQLHAHVAHQEPVPAALLGQGVAQADRHEHAQRASISTTRPTSPTPTTSAPPTSPSRRASPIRSTTSWCGGRRSWR